MATQVFADTFTRADNASMGSEYVERDPGSTGTNTFSVVSNQARVINGGGAILSTTTTAHAALADQDVSVTQVSSSGDGGVGLRVGPFAGSGISGSTLNRPFYHVEAFPSGGTLVIKRIIVGEGAYTTLASASITGVANGIVRGVVTGTTSGVRLRAYYNGTLKIDTVDTSASRITTAAFAGIWAFDNGVGTLDYDNFSVSEAFATNFITMPFQRNIVVGDGMSRSEWC